MPVQSILALARRRRDDEEGFTLIELMVVVLIIAILIAIAIPTFLGARQRAQDRAAQSDLRNGLTAEKTVYTDNQTYDATTATMQGIESSLNWNGVVAGKTPLHVYVGDAVNPNERAGLAAARPVSLGTAFAIISDHLRTQPQRLRCFFGTASPQRDRVVVRARKTTVVVPCRSQST